MAAATIERLPHDNLGALVDVFRKGIFDIKADTYVDPGEGVPFVRIGDLRGGLISKLTTAWISHSAHALEEKTQLSYGDIVLSKTAYPAAAFVNLINCNVSQDTIAVRLSTYGRTKYCSGYIIAFLNSSFGLPLMERQFQGNVQQHLSLDDGKKLAIPRFGMAFQNRVDGLVRSADATHDELSKSMGAAEAALVTALGLADWSPPEPLSYTANSSNAFASGRLDAQFYRPKYDRIVSSLRATGSTVELGHILTVNSRGRQPNYAEDGLPVVNSKHVRINRVELDDDNRSAVAEPSPVVIEQGDVLLNGTGVGTIGRAAPYLRKQPALPDNHVTVLRAAGLDPIYLSVFLNSLPGQLQIERLIKGSSGQIELYPDDIAKIIVWDAPRKTQDKVRDQVLAAFALEHKAQSLLDAAKRAVEIAIEEGEKAALRYLEDVGE